MKRQIIEIDESKCTGCGLCIPACPEGAIEIIGGKARLREDRLCDGLGACLGHCPERAIRITEREAMPFDKAAVEQNTLDHDENTEAEHLNHLLDHGRTDRYDEAYRFLKKPESAEPAGKPHQGCPGSRSFYFEKSDMQKEADQPSALTHWPIQLHLIAPSAPHYRNKGVLLAADCTAFTAGDFHPRWLAGRSLAIACPKLDEGQEIYVEKIKALIDEAQIESLMVLMMQVPCCSGLLRLARFAASQCRRKIPIRAVTIDFSGHVLQEQSY
ncbi:MAG: 4Fe-4S binding protein [candidate division KSB1 bacterium]|nr:4Fe-4S binding protein [candidate division KSB1 bacterium]